MGISTVNIGSRQHGRLRAPSVIHCTDNTDAICVALAKSLSKEQRELAGRRETPYGRPGAARRIVDVLETVSLNTFNKPFVNHGYSEV